MTSYNLPKDFLGAGQKAVSDVYIYPYQAKTSTHKNRVILTTHLFSFLTEGNKEIVMTDSRVKIDKEQFALITAGNSFMSEKISGNFIYTSTLFFFDNSLLQTFYLSNKDVIDAVIKKRGLEATDAVPFRHDDFTRLYAASLSYVPGNSAGLKKLKLLELLHYLLDTQPMPLCSVFAAMPTKNDDLIFKNTIDGNIDSNLSIQELAFICNMGFSTFKRKFSKIFGDSPASWMKQKRMEHAAFLLAYNQERPSDIYLRLGYDSLSSFSQAFKSIYGKTPKEYQMSQILKF